MANRHLMPVDISLTVKQANEVVSKSTNGKVRVIQTGYGDHSCIHLCRVGETFGVRLLPQDMTHTGLAIAVTRLELYVHKEPAAASAEKTGEHHEPLPTVPPVC